MEPCLLKCFTGLFTVLCYTVLLRVVLAVTDPVEVDALRSFHFNIDNDPMDQLKNWVGDDPCGSSWNGVSCVFDNKTQMQHIHEIRLMNMGLKGTLAPDLGNLSRLYILNVMWNNFSGSIPPEIGNLSNLYLLLLNGNNLSGTLPDSLGNLSNLNRIQIDQNKISGSVPKTFSNLNNAKHFHMNNNSLSGTIPSELGTLKSLVHLLLDNNNLTGFLPDTISKISTLLIVQLDNNQFSGGIPMSYSDMSSLTKLSLRNCSLGGFIPDLSKLSDVAYLDLSHNNFTGPLPSGMLSDNLTTIDLSFNQLSGEIPSVYSNLPNLQSLTLRNNLLNGTVPQILNNGLIFSSAAARLLLDFQYNHFTGNNLTNIPSNVVIRLYGNEWCDQNPSSLECVPTDKGISATFQNVSTQNASNLCSESTCDSSINQELFIFQGQCVCSFPIFVGYRLKSPGFAYFAPYENAFYVYLSSGLELHTDQVKVMNYTWQPGPRLYMNLNIFPTNTTTREFNSSEFQRLHDMFTNWMIPDNNTFGPYEVLSFPVQFPYNEAFNTGSSSGLTGGAIAGIVVGTAAITAVVVALLVALHIRKRNYIIIRSTGKNIHHERIKVAGVKDFTYEEMSLATNNFSSSMQVGQGGYGKVYKGILVDGQVVAIKRAQEGSLQGSKEFYTEIELLSRVHHRSLVSLVGYCNDEGEQMLVYEFMSNGTLRNHLDSSGKKALDFRSRLQIALGSARGILYLHTEANPPIYHRDIKATNILLDEKKRAKVADFGLSRLAPAADLEGVAPAHVSTVVKGTPGYLDPEYFLTHKLTDKSDVYSFGVVLLEIITGMHPISHGKNIVREVNMSYEAGMMLSVVDPRMGSYASEALGPLVRLALTCCKDDPNARPSMAEVVRDLEDIWRIAPWEDSCNSFESSEMKLTEINKATEASSNPYISSNMEEDLMSGTIPNVAPR